MTFTRTHVYVAFANPFLVCDLCLKPVRAWHDPDKCGCDARAWNEPCGCHDFGVRDTCPSWSPVDGCQCQAHLGTVQHAPAPNGDAR